MDNEITVLESRCIENLGYNSPNSDLFWTCVKKEFGIDDKNEELFDFEQGGSTPQVLIGLKNGASLARNVPETEVLAMGLKTPWLSPSLQIWKTALSTKLLITGSLGVNPLLVEKKSNFPRFKVRNIGQPLVTDQRVGTDSL